MDIIWKTATVAIVVFEQTVDRATASVATTRSGTLSKGKENREEIKSVAFPSTLSGSVWSGLISLTLVLKLQDPRLLLLAKLLILNSGPG